MYAEKEKIYGPVVLKNPIIIENGSEFSLDKVHPNKFSKSELEARQSITDLKNGLYKIERSFKNLCKNTRTIENNTI